MYFLSLRCIKGSTLLHIAASVGSLDAVKVYIHVGPHSLRQHKQ